MVDVRYSRLSLNGIFKQRHAGFRIAIGRRYDIQNQYHLERVYCIALGCAKGRRMIQNKL